MNKKKTVSWKVKRIFLNKISTEEFLRCIVKHYEKQKEYFGQTTTIQKNLNPEDVAESFDKTKEFQKETRIFWGDVK